MQRKPAGFPGREFDRLRQWAGEPPRPLLEPVLQPSPWRLRAVGLTFLVGHPLFYVIGAVWLPQPYESPTLRAGVAAIGAGLLALSFRVSEGRWGALAYSLALWAGLPLFFSWMFLCNRGNPVWLASMGAMLLIYYEFTDWRLATIGAASGLVLVGLLFQWVGPPGPLIDQERQFTNAIVLASCWLAGLALGLSSFSLHREQLERSLATIRLMAHELRTPLATVHLIAEATRRVQAGDSKIEERLQRLAHRLESVVRTMHHQIDTDIANARLTHLPAGSERIGAGALVLSALADYPFPTPTERKIVTVHVKHDFHFTGSRQVFSQVVTNLTKNALRALASRVTKGAPHLVIEVSTSGAYGTISFTDNGVGMSRQHQARLFQPFVATDRGVGHGLGLAFCQRVVRSARGTIRVSSAPDAGATFTIKLPQDAAAAPRVQ